MVSCSDDICLEATDSEWTEVKSAFDNDKIDWPLTLDGLDFIDYNKTILCATAGGRGVPVGAVYDCGYINKLSEMYPAVVFKHKRHVEYSSPETFWLCDGHEYDKEDVQKIKKEMYDSEIKRCVKQEHCCASGTQHQAKLTNTGLVIVEGSNQLGECETSSWKNIKEISCGCWHTVGLQSDGTLVACGSNANGQCDVSDIGASAKAVSCGRYHTAVLLSSGKVVVKGNLAQDIFVPKKRVSYNYDKSFFPIYGDLVLSKSLDGWEKMNERIEYISVGDELKLSLNADTTLTVCNSNNEIIGHFSACFVDNKRLSRILDKTKISVESVTPVSARQKGAKYAEMKIRIDYVGPDPVEKKKRPPKEPYHQTPVAEWPAVERIKSVFDAVIGVTADGQIYVDGYCPCNMAEIENIVKQA